MNRTQLKDQILKVVAKEVAQLGTNSDRLYKKFMAQLSSLKKESAAATKEKKRITNAQKILNKLSPEVRKLYKEVSALRKSLSSQKIKISSLAGYLKEVDKYNKKFKQLVEKIKKSPLTKLNKGLDSVIPYSRDTDLDLDLDADDVKEVSPLTDFLKDLSKKSVARGKKSSVDEDPFGFGGTLDDDPEDVFEFPSLGGEEMAGDDPFGFDHDFSKDDDPFDDDIPGFGEPRFDSGYTGDRFGSGYTPRYTGSGYTPRYTRSGSGYTSRYTGSGGYTSRYTGSGGYTGTGSLYTGSKYTPRYTGSESSTLLRPYTNPPNNDLLPSQKVTTYNTLADTRVMNPISGRPRSESVQRALGNLSVQDESQKVLSGTRSRPMSLMSALSGRRTRF